MRHEDEDAERRIRDALSKLPLLPDPAGAFAALDKRMQPAVSRAWEDLVRRVTQQMPEELQDWSPQRIAASIWLNMLVRDVLTSVRRDIGDDAKQPSLPEGAEECMQEVQGASEGMLSALVLTALEHVQSVLEAVASGRMLPECPACELEARFTDVLRSVLSALEAYHVGPPEEDDAA